MMVTNRVGFTSMSNGHSFLAGEVFEVLANGEVSVWLQHKATGTRLFVSAIFFDTSMEVKS